MSNKPEPLCVGCLIDAIAAHHKTLFAWLNDGGDARLLEFSPLDSWGPIVKMIAAAQEWEKPHHFH